MNILEEVFSVNDSDKDAHEVVAIPERLMKHEKVIIITADNTEDIEFFYPYYRLTEEGYTVDVVTPKGEKFAGKHGLGISHTKSIDSVDPDDYVMLYIPGGKAPETLRKDKKVIGFVKDFARSGRPIAAICHGPQVLISAGLVNGKNISAWPEVRSEIEKAGGTFVDEALVIDGQFITSRNPGDLHRHLWGVIEHLKNNAPSGIDFGRKPADAVYGM